MADPNYKRTTRYRNFMNQRCYLPIIMDGIADFGDRLYEVRSDGWRRLSPKGKDK
jgi:hypothetical protein